MSLKVELERAAKSVLAQGQGVWRIEILFPENATDLLLSATQGDELAARMLSMLFQAINEWQKRSRLPCASCAITSSVTKTTRPPPLFFSLPPSTIPGDRSSAPYAMPAPSKPDRTRRAKAQGKHDPRSAGPASPQSVPGRA